MDPTLQQQVAQEMLRILGSAAFKASATSPQSVAPHGFNALFNTPGLEFGVVSAVVQPMPGLWGFLEQRGHVRTSNYLNPVFGILTGQTASTGTEPTTACAPGRTPGNLKLCQQTWPFGRQIMTSQVIRIDNAGELINRGESVDLRLINNPFGDLPQAITVQPEQLFRNKAAKAVIELLNAIRRDYCGLVYSGNPTNTSGNTGYVEYNGLDRIINNAYRDSISNERCKAADSLIVESLASRVAQSSPDTVVQTIAAAYRAQVMRAKQTRLDPVQFAFFGRYGLFMALTEIWPCAYRTYRCSVDNAATINRGDDAMTRMTDEMRQGAYLLIDGERVPFVIDECASEIFVDNNLAGGGTWESDLYLLPITSPRFTDTDGAITYLDFFNWRAPGGTQDVIELLQMANEARVSADGRFLVLFEPMTHGCKQVSLIQRPRLIVRAPFLAARFTDLRYQKMFAEASAFPGNAYNLNGGLSSFAGQTFVSPV